MFFFKYFQTFRKNSLISIIFISNSFVMACTKPIEIRKLNLNLRSNARNVGICNDNINILSI